MLEFIVCFEWLDIIMVAERGQLEERTRNQSLMSQLSCQRCGIPLTSNH